MRITIGIPTRDRPQALARLLASLHAQTYQDFDLIIVDDSVGGMLDDAGKLILNALATQGHEITILPGARINQAYSHNAVLWHHSTHPLIMRVDDDMILSPGYIDRLLWHWWALESKSEYNVAGKEIGAVSGTIFTEHIAPRDTLPPIPMEEHGSVKVGPRGDQLWAIPFMQEYTDDSVIETEHLYSSYLYDRDAMRQAGGFPLVYTQGVSYHEETDASYRLHLMGYGLYLCPAARAVHSHEGAGGTRLMSPAEHGRRRIKDWETFQLRLGALRGIPNWAPRVAICSQHCSGIGGGQKLTYQMIDALNRFVDSGTFKCVHLLPLNEEKIESAEFVGRNFGATLRPDNLRELEEYDVVISIGHKVPDMGDIPSRLHHIHYSLFPMSDDQLPKGVDRFVTISDYSAIGVRRLYYRNAETIYPYVIGPCAEATEKHKEITLVGRAGGLKALQSMCVRFLDMDLLEGTILNLVLPEESGEPWLKEVLESGRVKLHVGVEMAELYRILGRSLVLWAGRGYESANVPPEYAYEHFGYTPVEALFHNCVPVAYNGGGYCETTLLRWDTLDELEAITRRLLEDREYWASSLQGNQTFTGRFSADTFANEWWRVICSTNGLAWEQEIEWRSTESAELDVMGGEPHVAVISEHPALPTGYGLVCRQICDGLTEAGMKVHVFGINGSWPDLEGRYASLWPSPRNVAVNHSLPDFCRTRPYHVALVMYDPFLSERLVNGVKANMGDHVPIVSYVSQEGRPAHQAWESILAKSRATLTYSHATVRAISERFEGEIGVAYPGVDHAPFRRYDEETRQALRNMLGWEDLFIVFNVGTNKRHKGVWRLMKTLRILRQEYGVDNAKLLLHTNAVPEKHFHGIDVEMYAGQLRLNPRDVKERNVLISVIGKDGVGYESDLNALFRQGVPRSDREAHEWFCQLSMIDRYNLADLYLDMSSAEGFGLPLLEAMACGVPCITVDDGYVRRELIGDHPSLLQGVPLDTSPTGADLMLSSPDEAAARIYSFMNEDKDAAIQGARAEEIVARLKWGETVEIIAEAIKKCL